jgi:DNA-binding protein HU-beta
MNESKQPKKKPAAKKAVAKKTTAKKASAKKAASQKSAEPRKRPAASTTVITKPPKTSTAKADIKVEVTTSVPEKTKQTVEKSANVVKANDIVNPSLRARVLKWFTRK